MRDYVSSFPPLRHKPAFTIMELLLVVSILAVLAVLIIPSYRYFRRRAEDAVCMENLRTLHTAFSAYLGDHAQVWPQSPNAEKNDTDESDEAKWWYETLKPYGPTRRSWLCPADRKDFAAESDEDNYDFNYIPTQFDNTPNIAYKWNQPWLIENGGFHDKSMANMVMPQGNLIKSEAPSPTKK